MCFVKLFLGRGNKKSGKSKRKKSQPGSTPLSPQPHNVKPVKIAEPVVIAAERISPSQKENMPAVTRDGPSTPVPKVESEIKVRPYYTGRLNFFTYR